MTIMTRALQLLCFISLASLAAAKDEAVVMVIDPVWDDTAGYWDNVPLLREYKVVKVYTRRGQIFSYVPGHLDPYRKFTFDADAPDPVKSAAQMCPQLLKLDVPVAAVIPTSDATVQLADLLAACTKVRGNPSTGPLAEARRDKWVMGEAVRKAGLRSIREKKVSTWDEAEKFLTENWTPPLSDKNPCIFKILAGSSGEGVYEVKSMKQGKQIFDSLEGSKGKFGEVNTLVLIQEYLQGREYAIDTVSRDGVHKVVAVWFEDFRPANGVFDQYFGFQMLDPADAFTKRLIDYSNAALDAMGLTNGAANTEVKFLEAENQPCLVETNARWAGISWNDGLAVERLAAGVDQITAAFNAYLDEEAFKRMPAVPTLKQNGAMLMLVNYQSGVLKGIPGLDDAKKYPSYVSCDGGALTGIGKAILPTVPNTIPVQIALVHKEKSVVFADYYRIIDRENSNTFFDVRSSITSLRANVTGAGAGAFALFATAVLAALAMALFAAGAFKREASDGMGYIAVE